MTRFLHTGDWQLGMTRHFLTGEAQARYAQDRLDAIRRMGDIVRSEECAFVVVAGDVFESNQVGRQTVVRALEALRSIPAPVYLLPGNHDPLDLSSVYLSKEFTDARPEHVHVLGDSTPREAAPGVDVIGVPWASRRPGRDLVTQALGDLEAGPDRLRVLVAHGIVDVLSPDPENPEVIRLSVLEAGLAEGRLSFVALGDRHSVTDVGASGRVWYAGTHEATDFDEEAPGNVLVVDLSPGSVSVTRHRAGNWRFLREVHPLNSDQEIDLLRDRLDGLPGKERTVLKMGFTGTLTLSQNARWGEVLDRAGALFGALQVWSRKTDLTVVSDDADFADLDLAGFARETMDELRGTLEAGGACAEDARDALSLLVRLARRTS